MSALLIPLTLWDDFVGVLGAAMTPLYWAVSGILVGFHWLLTDVFGMDPNWGVTWALSIILLTALVRTLLIPLFVKQINSSRNMQLLQPKVKALSEKYGHDRDRLGQETMKLYREEGVNPMASCLPLLLQMPIFLALFYVLNSTSNGNALGYFFETNPEIVTSLKQATIFGAPISGRFMNFGGAFTFGPTQMVALVLVVLMTVVLFITQLQLLRKNMPPESLTGPMAQQQKMMLYMFPLIYAVGGVSIPIGVLIYWLTTNLWTMGQQYILIHNNPAPGTPAFVDWEERLRAKGLDPVEVAAKRRGTKRPTATSGSTVSRQGEGTAAPESNSTPDEEPKVARQVIQRQQPRNNSRSKRKKG
jgi:YidC/Oxa1 family membrane protein insertase